MIGYVVRVKIKKMKKFRIIKDTHGQSVVEFALVAPILILLVCAVIDLGYIFFNKVVINNAAKEGIRMMSVGASATEVEAKVKADADLITSPDKLSIDMGSYNSNLAVGSDISITVTYPMDAIPLLDNFKNITLQSVYHTRLESPPN